jgi:nitroreductase
VQTEAAGLIVARDQAETIDFQTLIANRRMTRSFTSEAVAEDALARVTNSLRWAPSGANAHGQRFVVVTDQKTREGIATLAGEDTFVKAGFIAG